MANTQSSARSSLVAATVVVSSFLIFGCSNQQNSSTSVPTQTRDQIFSDRPVDGIDEMLMVELKSPALLESAEKIDGKVQIPNEKIQEVLAEQAAFEVTLKNLSPDIQVIYRYRFTLNGMSIRVPAAFVKQIPSLAGVKSLEKATVFEKPVTQTAPAAKLGELTSVSFIGTKKAHELGFSGEGVQVAVLDSGIDFTHKMLGGTGIEADYKKVDPAAATPFFPNEKVVGGIDLVGSKFSPGGVLPSDKYPVPDANPIDESGHGTHVAGTIAGIGDGVNTYDGVAPGAKLHAVKVFGAGGTFDSIVIAGFEYSLDPNGDMDISDRVDVINLSLGGNFGTAQILYAKAIGNIGKADITVVAAAGNSGEVPFIVGAPSTTDSAISVAASIDGREVNWRFPTVKVEFPDATIVSSKFIEGEISSPIKDIAVLKGNLVDIGMADAPLTPEKAAELNGKVALIKRGVVPFIDKLKLAQEAGAIAALVYNNEPGEPIGMGGEGKVQIPAVMVSLEVGTKILESLKVGAVTVDFKSLEFAEEPGLVDTITSFSSRGPRSEDYGFKPEISAPGQQILSAGVGQGDKGEMMNGTSMASPHIAGVVALLKQKYTGLSNEDLKSLLMNSAKTLDKVAFSAQGSGRVQVDKAIEAKLVATPSIALGLVEVPAEAPLSKEIQITNLGEAPTTVSLSSDGEGLTFDLASTVTINAGETVKVPVQVNVLPYLNSGDRSIAKEVNGRILISSQDSQIHVPVLGVRSQRSQIESSSITVEATPIGKSQDFRASVQVTNASKDFFGFGLLFNLIGTDAKKAPTPDNSWKSTSCDLESVGYRTATRATPTGQQNVIQFAFQFHDPINNLKFCDLSIQVDGDGDGVVDQEIVGVSNQSIAGIQQFELVALILDAKVAKAIRSNYEKATNAGLQIALNYQPAVLWKGELGVGNFSGIALLEIPADKIAKGADGKFKAKIATTNIQSEAFEPDDYLGDDETQWRTLSTNRFDHGYWGLPEGIELLPGASKAISFVKSQGPEQLVLYAPTNGKKTERLTLP